MAKMPTRREFIGILTAAGTLGGLPPLADTLLGAQRRSAKEDPSTEGTAIDPTAVARVIRRRARWQLEQRRLVVDYYRIGRKMAYPLPVPSLSLPEVPVPGIAVYPWATWMLWTLEERILVLGWAAEWFDDPDSRHAAAADLAALAQWPQYAQYGKPDLSSAHAGRILWTAATKWRWVGEPLRQSLQGACRRHVQSILPESDKVMASVETKDDILRRKTPYTLLHNIHIIGTVGAALSAGAAGHPAARLLGDRVKALVGAVLDLRAQGFCEGVAYDGYVLDFVADWLSTLSEEERSPVLDHPHLAHYLDESYMLGAPGAAEGVAELSDVEPREMPFHLSAQAKLLAVRPNPVRAWHLARCPLDVLRTDALAALREAPHGAARKAPASGALDAHYAAVLRSGWEADDLAIAVSCSHSAMGHIQADNGTLVLGTRGKWLIADPGYQQYAKGEEREFTVGPFAHNAPLVNGLAQTAKRPRRIVLEDVGTHIHRVALDLAACYPASAGLESLVRNVWLSSNNMVVVADQLQAKNPPQVAYHWHGHPAAAWWFEAGWAMVTLDDTQLWVACPQAQLSGANLNRLPGSRGQLTLVTSLESAGPVVWWVFSIGEKRPVLETSPDGREIHLLGQAFRV